MNSDRRRFLKLLTSYFAMMSAEDGLFTRIIACETETKSSSQKESSEYNVFEHLYVYLIDTKKSIGCGLCVKADRIENNVPANYYRTWVERYQISEAGDVAVDSPSGGENGFPPTVSGFNVTKAFFVPKLCNHCSQTPCVQVCPVGASYKTPDGVILVDEKMCIGCGYCVQACPYGSRFINPVTHCASKCTLCYHRIVKGLKPACVLACPVEARLLGDLKREGDPVRQLIARERVMVLQPELLTKPNCYYLELDLGVR